MSGVDVDRSSTANRRRLPFYDNVKAVLIYCVVLGHLLDLAGLKRKRRKLRSLYLLIYSFHMPLFIFVSGLFLDRRKMTRESVLRHAATYAMLGLLAKLLRTVVPWLLGRELHLTLLAEAGLPWFMFALATYYLVAWALRHCGFVEVGVASVMLALYTGYVPAVGDVLCLSRIIVFFPFFWLGHALSPHKVARLFERRGVRIVSAVVLMLSSVYVYRHARRLFKYRKLFLGRYAYALTRIKGCVPLHRLGAYLASLVMSSGVLGLVPHRRLPALTRIGARTLQVYLLHYELLDALRKLGLIRMLGKGGFGWLHLVLLAAAITLLMAALPFERPRLRDRRQR